MQKPTKDQIVFLAATGLTATIATAAVVPEIVEGVQQAREKAIEASKDINPWDAFANGIVVGGAAGLE